MSGLQLFTKSIAFQAPNSTLGTRVPVSSVYLYIDAKVQEVCDRTQILQLAATIEPVSAG